jgi:hypothetical protein
MAAALTVSAVKTRNNCAAALTGGPASAAVVFIAGSGSQSELINATTDGSGNATVNFVPPSPGLLSIRVIQHVADVVIAGPITATISAGG